MKFSHSKIAGLTGGFYYRRGVPQENMQSNSRTRELKSNADWVIALDYGAVGLTASSLAMLVIQLVFAGDPYRRGHSIWLVAALVGFVVHVCTSRILLRSRDARIYENVNAREHGTRLNAIRAAGQEAVSSRPTPESRNRTLRPPTATTQPWICSLSGLEV